MYNLFYFWEMVGIKSLFSDLNHNCNMKKGIVFLLTKFR